MITANDTFTYLCKILGEPNVREMMAQIREIVVQGTTLKRSGIFTDSIMSELAKTQNKRMTVSDYVLITNELESQIDKKEIMV